MKIYIVKRIDNYSGCACSSNESIIGIFDSKKELNKQLREKRKGEFSIIYEEDIIEIDEKKLNELC